MYFSTIIYAMKKYDKQPWSADERRVLRDYYYVLDM